MDPLLPLGTFIEEVVSGLVPFVAPTVLVRVGPLPFALEGAGYRRVAAEELAESGFQRFGGGSEGGSGPGVRARLAEIERSPFLV